MALVILVLTAGFGDGHNTAAASTAEALRRLCPDEEVQVCDLISEVQPLISGVLKSLYQLAITHFPSGWRAVYRLLEKTDLDPQQSPWLRPLIKGLGRKLEQTGPRLIVSTFPIYADLLQALRDHASIPPLLTVVTDSISVHPIWVKSFSDAYCVADVETEEVLFQMGIPKIKVFVTGFPVSLQFTEPLTETTVEAQAQRILYLPSTTATRVAQTLEALRPLLENGARLTMPVGKHRPRLYHVLNRFTDSLRDPAQMEIIGWTTRIPELLRTHDVVICKAGGAILHEVLAARIPAVIDYVVPGQEEGNAKMLLSRNCAYRTETAQQTGEAVAKILAAQGKIGHEMRYNMLPISVPDAALRTAHEALALVGAVTSSPCP